ncbi:MAG: glycosyltransferase family 4 protein [Candidatus Undinarchaeales archaeon]|nr:glycosyltransferase family 4 protein [Candidatus Undinarchaeales archaeon]
MKRLVVCIIAGDLDPDDLGGAEVHIVEVSRRLAERGHEVHLFVGNDDRISRIFKEKKLYIHPIHYPRLPNLASLLYMRYAEKAVEDFLRDHHVDILHAKQVFPFGTICTRLKSRNNIPVYVTVQNPYAYLEELVLNVPLLGRYAGSLIQRSLLPFVRNAISHADIVAAVSTYSQKGCLELGAKATTIVPNGVDTTQFARRATRREGINGQFHIVSTSTLIPRNGLEVLIESIALLTAEGIDVRVTLAGDGPLEHELKTLAQELGVSDVVEFIGTIPHNEVPKLLARSDIFVRPSIAEGFGVSFIEAMAVGVPVVTCPSGGIIDFVKNRRTGMLVPAGDPPRLRDAILELVHDNALYVRIVDTAWDMIRSTYDWETITESVEHAYWSLMGNNHCRDGDLEP